MRVGGHRGSFAVILLDGARDTYNRVFEREHNSVFSMESTAFVAEATATARLPIAAPAGPAPSATAGASPSHEDASFIRIPDGCARALRQRRLLESVPPGALPLPSASEVAARVLSNMVMTVGEQGAVLGASLPRMLKQPLPYDSTNRYKAAVMPELMPSVGAVKLADLAWAHLSSVPLGKPVVLVTGTSGAGKTKVAYDIGRSEAFVVVQRVVEHDGLTAPWEAFRAFAAAVIHTAAQTACASTRGGPGPGDAAGSHPLPLAERVALKAALIVLLGAHLEWAVLVSEAAVSPLAGSELEGLYAAALGVACSGSTSVDNRTSVLRQLVLRAQRNAVAYQHVAGLFRSRMRELLDAADAIDGDGTLRIHPAAALSYFERVVGRAKDAWGRQRSADGGDMVAMPKIVWAHDEVQALQEVQLADSVPPGHLDDLFDGVFTPAELELASPGSFEPPSEPLRPSQGFFFGLLAAIHDITGRVHCGHLLLGNSSHLPAQVLGVHSPVRSTAKWVNEALNLSADDIRGWLEAYLTPEAMTGADAALLEQLCGRPLFASHFWTQLVTTVAYSHCGGSRSLLVSRCAADSSDGGDPASVVRRALQTAIESMTSSAELQIKVMWQRHAPPPDAVPASGSFQGSTGAPNRLLQRLFHSLVMESGTDTALDTTRMQMEVEVAEAIRRGVLHAKAPLQVAPAGRSGRCVIQLAAEPCTAAALRAVGVRRMATGEDDVLELLAARCAEWTEPPLGVPADGLGDPSSSPEAALKAFMWQLVRPFLLRSWASRDAHHASESPRAAGAGMTVTATTTRPGMSLGELLGPFFARAESTMGVRGSVHPAVLPAVCDDYEVLLTHGCRADVGAWRDRCPLELLATMPNALVHGTDRDHRMGGPDIMFLAHHRVTGDTRPVLLQLQKPLGASTSSYSLLDALSSVNMDTWYAESGAGRELPAHAHMRAVLAAHPQWALPIRVVASSRPVNESMLLSSAWLNQTDLACSPVLLLHLTRANLGLPVDIVPRGDATSGAESFRVGPTAESSSPRCLWPTPVTRNWDAAVPALPAAAPCPAIPVVASLKVKLTSRASTDAIVASVQELARHWHGQVYCVRHWTFLSRNRSVTATFNLAVAAFGVLHSARAGALTAEGHIITAAFV